MPANAMPLYVAEEVLVSDDVYHVCLHQALSTEKEEVLGMLMGRVTVDRRALVWAATAVPRNDKRPDRVEISPEQLCAVAEEADQLTDVVREKTRVIGWYHSHPRITPYPSHVDLNTQATCQLMERCWVGLIFSVFNADKRAKGRVTLHCFATNVLPDGSHQHVKVPVRVVPAAFLTEYPPPPMSIVERLPALLADETQAAIHAARARVISASANRSSEEQRAGNVTKFNALAALTEAESTFQTTQLFITEAQDTAIAALREQRRREELLRQLCEEREQQVALLRNEAQKE